MEVRGTSGGITVIDDFGHHPTAIRETLRALRVKFPRRPICAIFEPRSNTTRRNVFQKELAEALCLADSVIVSEVARLEQIDPSERLNPEGMAIELAIRQWARSDENAATAVASVDAARLKHVAELYRATGLEAEAAEAQAFLFYCFIFGQSLLFVERGPRKRSQLVAKSAEKLLG